MADDGRTKPAIHWFRQDLRLADNPALTAAARHPLIAVYILDDSTPGLRRLGAASRWWLDGSLAALSEALAARGAALTLLRGKAEDIIVELATSADAAAVHWNRRYDAAERAQDAKIKERLRAIGVEAHSHNSHLLREPWEVANKSGGAFKVFSPFWRASLAMGPPAAPLPAPEVVTAAPLPGGLSFEPVPLAALGLKPTSPNWAVEMESIWRPGEAAAASALTAFLDSAVDGYGERRNRPDQPGTSQLSPRLKFGEIGPRQVWRAAQHAADAGAEGQRDVDKFLSEIGWREFSYHLLFHAPDIASQPFQPRFAAFPYRSDLNALAAWRRGRTGYPIVDAGMRQLWRTGWMHNRVRMIVASFLVKHLLLDWREGEDWFWDTLIDADPASNPASWQWVGGSGADAAPYFRIFAPVLQGEKFDPDGAYVRKYVPELAKLPANWIHKPWEAPPAVLSRAGVTLGDAYPRPIVRHEDARARALAAFKTLSASQQD